jgi:hypothetical protein
MSSSMTKEEANRSLCWFIDYVLRDPLVNPLHARLIGQDLANRVRVAGYWWQADRIENHLHRFLKSLQPKADPPRERRGGHSH